MFFNYKIIIIIVIIIIIIIINNVLQKLSVFFWFGLFFIYIFEYLYSICLSIWAK